LFPENHQIRLEGLKISFDFSVHPDMLFFSSRELLASAVRSRVFFLGRRFPQGRFLLAFFQYTCLKNDEGENG